MIEYIGKCLLIDKKILVVGDLHLGYIGSLRRSGVFLYVKMLDQIEKELEEIFERTGKVECVVLLGDVKHAIGSVLWEEREEVRKLFEMLKRNSGEIVLLKGNHDVLIDNMLKGVKAINFLVLGENAFLHGDKNFKEIEGKKIKRWIMGHVHPAVTLREGGRSESYKCFLTGKYKGREVIVVPSFFPLVEGSDPRESDLEMPWDFNWGSFQVRVVNGLEIMDFGKLKSLL